MANKVDERYFSWRDKTESKAFGGNWVTQYENPGSIVCNGTFSGIKNPDWKRQVRDVVSATTPASGVTRLITGNSYSYNCSGWYGPPENSTTWREGRVSGFFGTIGALPADPSLTDASTVRAGNQAISRLYNRLNELNQSVMAGEDLGEIGQTIRSLTRPLDSAKRFVVNLMEKHNRALSMRNTQKAVKALADTVLEWNFGIKPLTSTVGDAIAGLQNRDNMFFYQPFSASGKDEVSSFGSGTVSGNGALYASVPYSVRQVSRAVVRYKGMWAAKADVPQRPVNQVLGLTWRNVIPTVYNLIPYSWLVDYFTNIGDIVSAIGVPWGGVRWCVRTRRNEVFKNVVITPKSNFSKTNSFSSTTGHADILVRSFDRSAQITMPVPELELQVPNLRQWSNVAALVASRIPILGNKTARTLVRDSSFNDSFGAEIGRRGDRLAYPSFSNK